MEKLEHYGLQYGGLTVFQYGALILTTLAGARELWTKNSVVNFITLENACDIIITITLNTALPGFPKHGGYNQLNMAIETISFIGLNFLMRLVVKFMGQL